MHAPEDNPIAGEEDFAAGLIEHAIQVLTGPDYSEHIYGIDDATDEKPLTRYQRKVVNKRFKEAGEPLIDQITSAHAAELCWLNHLEPCVFTVTLVDRRLNSTPRNFPAQIAKRVTWLLQDPDDVLLCGEAP